MKSREDETYIALNEYRRYEGRELYEIAMSLGRIADMLTEMNRYVVNYNDRENRYVVSYDDRKEEALCENQTEVNNET